MARPLRVEFEHAVYHAIARGNERAAIFRDDADRRWLLSDLDRVVERYGWICHAYCLMGNHFHLLIETPNANLSIGMRQLNGVYAARFNRRHDRVGHLFEGRFKAYLVEKDAYGLGVARYVVLNPVRARLCRHPSEWRWSSYRATAGLEPPHKLLTIDWLLDQLSRDRTRAHARYTAFVESALHDTPLPDPLGELYVGTQQFAGERHPPPPYSPEVNSRQQRATRPSLDQLFSSGSDDEIGVAVHRHGYRLAEVARHLRIHPSTVTRRLDVFEAAIRDVAEGRRSRPDP
ncbi:MAG TPA: transposase [Gaiellaceae bacterium]|nr:transposase [Gaiellaceae bacterium]